MRFALRRMTVHLAFRWLLPAFMLILILPHGQVLAATDPGTALAIDPAGRAVLVEINTVRRRLGLPLLEFSASLTRAAAAHARYLEANVSAPDANVHNQQPGLPHFTGVTVLDRALAAGWTGAGVAEIIAREPSVTAAVDGWLATPYHRGPLIHPRARLVGAAFAGTGLQTYQVAVLGLAADQPPADPIPYPAPGQQGVPTGWHGLETPNPLRFFPGARGPLGYTVSVSFPAGLRRLDLTVARLVGPDGEVPTYLLHPDQDEYLQDMVALLPAVPLAPLTAYTAEFFGSGEWGGRSRTLRLSWQFTTAAVAPDFSRTLWWDGEGGTVQFEVRGSGLTPDTRLFLGGLPVQAPQLTGSTARFQPPAGLVGAGADLLAVNGGGEVRWPDYLESRRRVAGFGDPPAAWALRIGEQPAPRLRALVPSAGDWLVPVSAVESLGGSAYRHPGSGLWLVQLGPRWLAAGPTTARAWAGSEESPYLGERLLLGRPPVEEGGVLYLPDAALAALGLKASPAPPDALAISGGPFPDLAGHWARGPVLDLAGRGIISGYPDGRFAPDRSVTRAEALKLMSRAAGLEPAVEAPAPLLGAGGHWVARQGWLQAALAGGLVRPAEYAGGLEPDAPALRLEVVIMAVRALGLEAEARARATAPLGPGYADAATMPATWRGHVAVAIDRGLIRGYLGAGGLKELRLERGVTRAEAAVITGRILAQREAPP